ncbi:CinA family protein [Rubrolithibacter danxiaensis]|uniref:CinA family protein n=1 Tax=Rubrolithibacter danxiaensis TaxID=3390805 RepID=UPI003BF8FF03
MPAKSVIACCHTLLEKKLTIAFAESASTGRLIYDFTSVPDCGEIVLGSIVCYDVSVKKQLLGVPTDIIEKYTAESAEVTHLLTLGVKKLIPADVIVAVTGLASEGGSETAEKPVGTMFIHGIVKDQEWKARLQFDGSPDEIIAKTIDAVASILLEKLN